VWREFDGNATGFINTNEIEPFIISLCKSNCDLVLFRQHLINHPSARRKFIAKLDIPTFKHYRKILF
jgi:hypothetical protein